MHAYLHTESIRLNKPQSDSDIRFSFPISHSPQYICCALVNNFICRMQVMIIYYIHWRVFGTTVYDPSRGWRGSPDPLEDRSSRVEVFHATASISEKHCRENGAFG